MSHHPKPGYGINTQADNLEEFRAQVRVAVACYFDAPTWEMRASRRMVNPSAVLDSFEP
jgi:hypothetical protein